MIQIKIICKKTLNMKQVDLKIIYNLDQISEGICFHAFLSTENTYAVNLILPFCNKIWKQQENHQHLISSPHTADF